MIRSIRPDTVIFTEKNQVNDLRLCDFFLAIKDSEKHNEKPFLIEEVYKSPETFFQGKKVFNPKHNHLFTAPELLPPENHLIDSKRYYSTSSDIWSFGCLIYNMFTGVPPFIATTDVELYKMIRQYSLKDDKSP